MEGDKITISNEEDYRNMFELESHMNTKTTKIYIIPQQSKDKSLSEELHPHAFKKGVSFFDAESDWSIHLTPEEKSQRSFEGFQKSYRSNRSKKQLTAAESEEEKDLSRNSGFNSPGGPGLDLLSQQSQEIRFRT